VWSIFPPSGSSPCSSSVCAGGPCMKSYMEERVQSRVAVVDFARLIADIRTASGLTQEQLAHELGVTYGTVNCWENGRHRPLRVLARTLLKRASRLGVVPQQLSDVRRDG